MTLIYKERKAMQTLIQWFVILCCTGMAQAAQLPRNPVIEPAQITWETEPVLSMAVSSDGQYVVYASGPETASDLWLGAIDAAGMVLPRQLTFDPFSEFFPAFSKDGRYIAYVGTSHDVKGDIYLLDLKDPRQRPLRLTGRDTGDGAPCFSPDGDRLYFHQTPNTDAQSRIVYMDLPPIRKRMKKEHPGFIPAEPHDTTLLGAFPAVSPSGSRIACVSYSKNPAGDILVYDIAHRKQITTVAGDSPKLFPAWGTDDRTLYFSQCLKDTNNDGAVTLQDRPSIIEASPTDHTTYVMTPFTESAIRPQSAKGMLFYLSDRGGVNNCWSQPEAGRIKIMDNGEDQIALAREMANRVPYSPSLTLLAWYAVLDHFSHAPEPGATAADAIAAIYRSLDMKQQACDMYAHGESAYGNVLPQAALARVMKEVIKTEMDLDRYSRASEKKARILKAVSALDTINPKNDSPLIKGKTAIEQAGLLLKSPEVPYNRVLNRLDAAISQPHAPQAVVAEAMLEKGNLYLKIGNRDQVLPIYMDLITTYPDQSPFSDLAVEKVLDLYRSTLSTDLNENILFLRSLGEKHLKKSPMLTKGALIRMGDLYYAAGDMENAKAAFETVLKRFPEKTAQTAAARLALAELFYREERFRKALDLYEKELSVRPFDDKIYQLARAGYIRKSISAGEYLFRIGEIQPAAKTFKELIDYDPAIVEAHRGYIKCAYAGGRIEKIIALYEERLDTAPTDPVIRYATGLALTYRDDRESLLAAKDLISQAIRQNGQIEYFHQTLGYIYEILENVYNEKNNLEKAITSYQKAYFLNHHQNNPDNAANLLLNLGNVSFNLGRYQKAYQFYNSRADMDKPFDHPETEILFYVKLGQSAFQQHKNPDAIHAFKTALEKIDHRMNPDQFSDLLADNFDKFYRLGMDTVITPSLKIPDLAPQAHKIFTRMSDVNQQLFTCLQKPAAPPDPAWAGFKNRLESLHREAENIVREILPLYSSLQTAQNTPSMVSVEDLEDACTARLIQIKNLLRFPDRYITLKTELLGRLALALQENKEYEAAYTLFETVFGMNKSLAMTGNLAVNRRNTALNKYLLAGTLEGAARHTMLENSARDFEDAMALVDTYGVAGKPAPRKGATISISTDIALEDKSATQGAFGFSAPQEKRICEAFLTKINMELDALSPARDTISRQLEAYPPDREIPEKDMHAVSLLYHNAGLIAYSGRDLDDAERFFLKSARLCISMGNPVSSAINTANTARIVKERDAGQSPGDRKEQTDRLRQMDRETTALLNAQQDVIDLDTQAAYHNRMGVYLMPGVSAAGETITDTVNRVIDLKAATTHFLKGISLLNKMERITDRATLKLLCTLHLNLAGAASELGEPETVAAHLALAENIADGAMLPQYKWRVLAARGQLAEAFDRVRSIRFIEADAGPMEIIDTFAPLISRLIDKGLIEEGFNLTEQISEIQRFHRTAFLLRTPSENETQRIQKSYKRLLTIRSLAHQVEAATGEEKSLLTTRLNREKQLLDDNVGKDLDHLPGIIRNMPNRTDREDLIILMGLARHADMLADLMVKKTGIVPTDPQIPSWDQEEIKALRKDRATLLTEYEKRFNAYTAGKKNQAFSGYPPLLSPQPVEAIDLMELLPEAGSLIRVFPSTNPAQPFIAFTLTPDDITAEQTTWEQIRSKAATASYLVWDNLSAVDTSLDCAWALNGAHLFRAASARKPFKKKLLPLPGTWKGSDPFYTLPDINTKKEAQTVLFTAPVMKTGSLPVRAGDAIVPMVKIASANGKRLDFPEQLAALSGMALAMVPCKTPEDIYLAGHLAAIYGCPSLVTGTKDALSPDMIDEFLSRYKDHTAIAALNRARKRIEEKSGDKAPTSRPFLLGYRGMTENESLRFSKSRFADYVKTGRSFYAGGQFPDAQVQFESAIGIAREIEAYQAYLPALLTFARESSFQAGNIVKSEAFARELVSLVAQSKPDTEEHADALLRHGLVLARLEKYDEAIPRLNESLEIISNLEIDLKTRETLINLAIVLEDAGQYSVALERFQSAAMLSRQMDKADLLADQYENIGRIYDLRLSNYPKAIIYYEKALAIRKEQDDQGNTAAALLNIGRCRRLTGNFTAADTAYEAAYQHVRDLPQKAEIAAKIIIEKANNAWFQGRYQEAFTLERDALKIAREKALPLLEIIALNTEGLIWWTLGENDRALATLNSALDAARTYKRRDDEIATTLNNIGLVHREQGAYQRALETFDQALDIDTRLQSQWAMAYDLRNKGLTYLKMKEPEQALPLFEKALDASMAIGNRINAAKALLGLAEALADTGQKERAAARYEEAFSLSKEMAIKETMWRALYGLALIRLSYGSDDGKKSGEALLYDAIDIIESMRSDIRIDQLKDSFIANKLSVYETLIIHLADKKDIAASLDVAERSRARNFIDLLGRQRLHLGNAMDQTMYDREKLFKSRIESQERLIAATEDPDERSQYQGDLDGLKREYETLMLEIQAKNPQLASLVSVTPLKTNDIFALLEPGVAMVSYYLLPDEVFIWILSNRPGRKNSVHLIRQPVGKTGLEREVFSYRRTIQNLEPFADQSKRLSNTLVKPVIDFFRKTDATVNYLGIVPHGALHYLSFATLTDNDRFLIDDYPLFYLPSLSVLQFTLERRRTDKNTEVLALGNPDLGNPALDLPFSEHEVDTIKWNFPRITILTRDRAKESWVDENIQRFGIIHIASHGEFDPVNPLFSAIKLTKDKAYDGNLEAGEIFGLDIRADLVVLSACQTGLGKITQGDDVIGLNRSFFYAGTHAIISSLWRVSDISTAVLVKQFYRMYVDKNKADSLRAAILHVKQSYPHPGYWGAFSLVGDYQ